MDVMEFGRLVLDNLPYEPTSQQIELVAALSRFCSSHTLSDSVFLLNGYAGTGKTSLCAALVKSLNMIGIGTVLLAPTGRAAKVFSRFARHPAYTIHRRIYSVAGDGITSSHTMRLAANRSANTVFIVDEASMIGAESSSGYLLEHLIHYVYSGVNCKLILLGDTAQLPPVGCEESPAMSAKTLHSEGLTVTRVVLTATVRQAADSGILFNATWLRKAMRRKELPQPRITATPFPDVMTVTGDELEDCLSASYSAAGVNETILITRSNMRATQFNLAIRYRILGYEEELCSDDLLLVAKNNYFWSRGVKGLDFLANGDTAVVEKIHGVESRYGFRFADVRLRLPDREVGIECKIILDTLINDGPTLGKHEMERLYRNIIADDTSDSSMATKVANAIKSPYMNALQVKYAYAVTCHKAQGGQWSDVYVDLGYIAPEAMGMEFYRWLYTAVTRATKSLYAINPSIEVR